ncbi:MAG: aminoacyl-tRNA hydrolase [Gammaproteobacteria bacterium]|nr:aminoacyl-tRNA hydrolase [Gammaproteobacteria bacterium]
MAGLGNPSGPGGGHAADRHNAGFRFLERLAVELGGGSFKQKSSFAGAVCRLCPYGSDLWLLKPSTFMNDSGRSLRMAADFLKLSGPDILVVHDDLDLPAGTARLKRKGGHGGHNGVRDILRCLGADDFLRLRFGIGRPPGAGGEAVRRYVLSSPDEAQRRLLQEAMDRALQAMPLVLRGEVQAAFDRLHGAAAGAQDGAA